MNRFPQNSLIFIAIGLHLLIALPLAWTLNLWLDEAWTMQTTANGALFAWREAVAVERQAPFYFVILSVWREINASIFFARLFSILCVCGSIWVFAKLARRFFTLSNFQFFCFTALFAVHPFVLSAALEARVYAFVVLIAGLLLLFWQMGFAGEREDKRFQLLYFLTAILALFTNYYLGFLLVGNFAALIYLHKRKAVVNYFWQMAIVFVIAVVPLGLIIKAQIAVNSDYYRQPSEILGGFKLIWGYWNDFLLPAPEIEILRVLRKWLVRALIFGGAAFVGWRLLRRKFDFGLINREVIALVIANFVAAAFFVAAYFLLGETYVEIRHAAPLFVMSMLLIFGILFVGLPKKAAPLTLALCAVFYFSANYLTYTPLAKRGDWARVAAFLAANEMENQSIAVFSVYHSIPLKFYYHGKNQILPAEVSHDWNAEAPDFDERRFARQINFLIEQIPRDNEQIWLISDATCDAPKTAVECRPLEQFVETNYVLEKTENFYQSKVRLLKKKEN